MEIKITTNPQAAIFHGICRNSCATTSICWLLAISNKGETGGAGDNEPKFYKFIISKIGNIYDEWGPSILHYTLSRPHGDACYACTKQSLYGLLVTLINQIKN